MGRRLTVANAASDVSRRLRDAGCVAAEEEAAQLVAAFVDDAARERAVERRLAGEPLAWIVGFTLFCGLKVAVDEGVYVPRWQTEAVARRAAAALPERGVALDLCCGSGAVAMVLSAGRTGARVIGTDIDARAIECARVNGVEALVGDLYGPVPVQLKGQVDVIVAVTPYVPSDAIGLLARTPEPAASLDGGAGGLAVVTRVVGEAPHWLRPGGTLIVELGEPQITPARLLLEEAGFVDIEVLVDGEGDVAGMAGRCQILS